MISTLSRPMQRTWRAGTRVWLPAVLAAGLALAGYANGREPGAARPPTPDTALVVAVDVSQSVDENRYRLQMEGIAQALEDPGVLDLILSGPTGGMFITLVVWADRPEVAIPWRRIASADDARRVAASVRSLPHQGGEFTCVARLLRFVKDGLAPRIGAHASRLVVDVSSDGIDNCATRQANDAARDALLASGATINGLPIFVKGENDVVGAGTYRAPGFHIGDQPLGPDTDMTTLDAWFAAHIIGGPGAFVLPAQGYDDFGRAIRRKFVVEISASPSDEALRDRAR